MQIITVGGMIGVGKTTYIDQALARDKEMGLKSKTIYELFEPDRLENSIFKEKTTRDEVMDLFLKLYYENVDKLTHNDELERVQGYTVTLGHQVNFLANRASKVLDAIEIAKQQGIDILYLDRTIFEDLIFTKRNLFDNQVY
jgi:deoxyadenosine/deoxycytidine kinase